LHPLLRLRRASLDRDVGRRQDAILEKSALALPEDALLDHVAPESGLPEMTELGADRRLMLAGRLRDLRERAPAAVHHALEDPAHLGAQAVIVVERVVDLPVEGGRLLPLGLGRDPDGV